VKILKTTWNIFEEDYGDDPDVSGDFDVENPFAKPSSYYYPLSILSMYYRANYRNLTCH
jgi:hypothetical protein